MTATTTIVTVTYGDRLGYLQQMIERSLAFAEIAQVIVVSNAALAPLDSLVERWPGRVKLIRLAHNTGSANGYAVALEAALADGAEYIWMMDDDNAPTARAVQILHEEVRRLAQINGRARVAVLGYRATQQADIAQGVPTRFAINPRSSYFGFHIAHLPYKLWRRLPWGKPAGTPPVSISLPYAPYGGMLAHRSLYQRIGVPLRDLVLYADDTEYTRRITADGGQLHLFTDATIDELEQSWNIKAGSHNIYETYLLGDSDFRAYYAARNQAWFDKNVWARSPLLYRLNRAIFLGLLRVVAWRNKASKRLALIEAAIREGETGRLGMSETFPLR
jgi:GT2 family glycosyltransferase